MSRCLSISCAVLLVVAVTPLWAQDPRRADAGTLLVITGTVERASADGDRSVPPDVRIFVDCHGQFTDGGGVTMAGQFRFTVKPDPVAIAAASLCTVEAKAFGFDSTIGRFSVKSPTGMTNIGSLIITRNSTGDAEDRGTKPHTATVSATSLRAPPAAVKQFNEATHLLQKKKFDQAAKSFERAVKIYPEYADAWMNLGLLAAQRNDLVTAARDLDESLRLDPAGSFQACYSDALVNLMLRRYAPAERAAREALRFGDAASNARVDYVLGMALLARGGNAEARQRLLRYLELVPNAPERDQVQKELARLDRLESAR